MGRITLDIDGKDVSVEGGMTILEVAKKVGVEIPTLCHDEDLETCGVCRICSVEIERDGRASIVAACCYPAEDGLKVRTRTLKINKIRKTLIELAAITVGEDVMGDFGALANAYNADLHRFRSRVQVKPINCILCGLCIQRCIEANWDSAIGFVGRGVNRQVVLFPTKAGLCSVCNYCYAVCPTGRISRAYGPNPPFPHVDDILAGRK